MSNDKPRKEKGPKKYTRAQAEKALTHGADPEKFAKHENYHVRYKAWRKMGSPLPEKTEDQNRFLATLQGKEVPKDDKLVPAFMAALRQKFLKEEQAGEVQAVVQDS